LPASWRSVTGEVGEFTTPSPPGIPTPPAVDLIDDSCLYVSAPMDEVDAPRLKTGATCAHHPRRPARPKPLPARCAALRRM
jgi:hypothetical protein